MCVAARTPVAIYVFALQPGERRHLAVSSTFVDIRPNCLLRAIVFGQTVMTTASGISRIIFVMDQ
jgi:hypothetical protein